MHIRDSEKEIFKIQLRAKYYLHFASLKTERLKLVQKNGRNTKILLYLFVTSVL